MPLSEPSLWAIIRKWPLPHRSERDERAEPPRLCTRFEHNLRKIGDWSDDASKSIAQAYRKFLYLKGVSGGTLTPPKWIDAAWHLHLSFPKDYASLEAAIGRQIVHSQDLSWEQIYQTYEHGRSLWDVEFDDEPPQDIWPSQKLLRKNRVRGVVAVLSWIGLTGAIVGMGIAGVSELLTIAFAVGVFVVMVHYLIKDKEEPDTISRCG